MSPDASSTSLPETRRRLLGGFGLLALGGCGFRPLYAPDAGGSGVTDSRMAAELAAVRVGLIPERNGQLLRRALQQRLDPQGAGLPGRYDLRASFRLAADPEGFHRDGTASRIRYTATATWALLTLGTPAEEVASGTARAVEAWNILDNQFFASDQSRGAAERRLTELLAEDIVLRLALRFRTPTVG